MCSQCILKNLHLADKIDWSTLTDVHSVASVLKAWYREQAEPLLTTEMVFPHLLETSLNSSLVRYVYSSLTYFDIKPLLLFTLIIEMPDDGLRVLKLKQVIKFLSKLFFQLFNLQLTVCAQATARHFKLHHETVRTHIQILGIQ